MEDLKYCKEGATNYLVMLCPKEKEQDFQIKMLERGNLLHFLQSKIRHINGESYFYYDISSKVSLKNYYQGKAWTREHLTKLIDAICLAQEELTKYLLNEEYLLLTTDTIFYDYDSREYRFLFLPFYKTNSSIFESLFEYLLDNLDHNDEELANVMYELFEEAEQGILSFSRLKKKLSGLEEQESELKQTIQHSYVDFKTRQISDTSYSEPIGIGCPLQEQGASVKKEERKKEGVMLYVCLLIFSLLGEGFVVFTFLFFKCRNAEKIILLAVGSVLLILLLVSAYFWKRESALIRRKKQYDRSLCEYRENDYEPTSQPVLQEIKMDDFTYRAPKGTGTEPIHNDETVFFMGENDYEYKLYALDRKNKTHISLPEKTCTIGKARDMVDYCLEDASVSRIHAKIEHRGGHYVLTDLNSKNGTYVNGMMLSPNEQIEIEPGDEIKFGKMRYCFR